MEQSEVKETVKNGKVGDDFAKCHEEPRAWIKENRPDMYEVIYA